MVMNLDLGDFVRQKVLVHRFNNSKSNLRQDSESTIGHPAVTIKNDAHQKSFKPPFDRPSNEQQQPERSFRRSFSEFDHHQKRYRTVCDKIHCWSAAKWVIGAEFVISTSFLIDFLFYDESDDYLPKAFLLTGLYLNGLSILAIFLYVFGMYKKWEKIMIPRFVAQTLNCILFVAFAVYCLAALLFLDQKYKQQAKISNNDVVEKSYAWLATGYFVAFALQVYFFWILLLAYRYLRDWNVFLIYV